MGPPCTPLLGRSRVPDPGRLCRFLAAGHKTWRRLVARCGLVCRPARGPCQLSGLRLSVFVACALAFARGLLPLNMRRAGVGGRSRLPVRSAPGVRCIIARSPARLQARGPAPTHVNVVVPPVRPSFRGRIGQATLKAVVVWGGGSVATTIVVGWDIGGTSLRLCLVISLRVSVGSAVHRTAVTAGTIMSPAPLTPSVPPLGGGGFEGVPGIVSAQWDGDPSSAPLRAAALPWAPQPSLQPIPQRGRVDRRSAPAVWPLGGVGFSERKARPATWPRR